MSNSTPICILAIESSCDDTSVAVMRNGELLSNLVASQSVHEAWGGVVPELASRAHQQNLVPLVSKSLKDAGVQMEDLTAIAFTSGPGLIGSLMVGTSFAKSMAWALNIPLIQVNHMIAHVMAHFIRNPKPEFPFLCLTVSGGHTQLLKVTSPLEMEILGETSDDAAGEAFDKGAKILGLPYPGGPFVDRFAKEGNPEAFKFPVAAMPGLTFSFSGLKTALLYFCRDKEIESPGFVEANMADICASYQASICKHLLSKVKKASEETGITQIALAGGVSANHGLRNSLNSLADKKGWNVFIPDFEFCTDNAAMIAMTAHYQFLKNDFASLDTTPFARWA
jgi:N6-L-threonylcarbamoyladenine synthase